MNAIYSGLPTAELTRVILDYVIPDDQLSGLYHVASSPINKFELLKLVAEKYGKKITITPDETVCIDRSLNADKFHAATHYVAPDWPQLVNIMHDSCNLVRD